MRRVTRNPGIPLNVSSAEAVHVDEAAATSRASEISSRPALTAAAEVDWLLQAIRSLDLTTLSDDDTEDRVRGLCERARRPVDATLAQALGID
ncbi:MAG: deoxyribose-phosphate aldolase, partial [Gemmatimonadota bacterium]